ncbi:MAG: O-antigen ligase family protein [Acidobacteriota bacterium]
MVRSAPADESVSERADTLDSLSSGRRPPAFWFYAGHLVALPGIAISNVLAGLAVLAAPRRVFRARWPPATRPLLVIVGVYALWLLASIACSTDPADSLRSASELFTLATLVLGLVLVRGERAGRLLVHALLVVATLVALWGLAQVLAGFGGLDRRIRGPFSHWMTFSHFLLVCDLLLIARLALARSARRSAKSALWWWVHGLALVLITGAIVASLTRSAWLALAVTVTLVLALGSPRWLLAYLPAAVLAVLLLPLPVLHRVTSITDLQDPSNYDRLCMAEAGLRMVAERPLFGIGPDQVKVRYAIYRTPTAPRYWVPHLHNSFLQLAAERGLPALAAYLALMLFALRFAWRGYRRRGSTADLHFGVFLALIAFNLAGLFENNWTDTEVQRLVLFLLALPFVVDEGAVDP